MTFRKVQFPVIIDHFSTFPHGGAGTAARRLHERLVQRGVESRFNYWKDEKNQQLDESFRQLEFPNNETQLPVLRTINRKLEKRRRRMICDQYDRHVADRPLQYELFSIPWSLEKSNFDIANMGSIVHLHWMAFFIDYSSFFGSIPDQTPIVWSFHDMNPLTGGCHYSADCSRFTVGCGNCQQIANPGPQDASYHGFRAKQRSLKSKKHLHIITPNKWLSDLAQHSPIFPATTQYHVIRLGLDENRFRPIDKAFARQQLGLPADVPLIAFGAEDIENHRKGFHHLLASLRKVQNESNAECLVFGNGKLPEDRTGLPRFHEFGFVDSVERHRLIYSAADLFVLPSREDNQPQTGLESMACRTPVVGFRAGGIPEYVRHEQTGLLATMGDEDEMAWQIMRLLDNPQMCTRLGDAARHMIENEFTAELQARSYMALYQRIADLSRPIEQQTQDLQPQLHKAA